MKTLITIFISITALVNVMKAQVPTNNTNELTTKEMDFKKWISNLSELKDGYEYHEYTKPIALHKITRSDYINYNIASFYDLKYDELSERYIIGYFKNAEDLYVILTVLIDNGEEDTKHYAPELMLYNKYGEKLSQINLSRNINDLTQANFTYLNQQFIRDYIRTDTLDFDPETGDEIDTLYFQQTHCYFNISFNTDGFLLKNKAGILIKLRNINTDDFGYKGEIVYPSGGIYKGIFDLSNCNYMHRISDNKGEYISPNGSSITGIFCGDSSLCNYPNLFVDKQLVENDLCFSKNELLKLKGLYANFNNQDYKVISYELGCLINGKLNMTSVTGNEFSLNVKKLFLQVDPNSKIWFDNIRVKKTDGHYKVLPMKYIFIQ